MTIDHIGGQVEANNIEKYEEILNIRNPENINEFWIAGEGEFPCLVLNVSSDYVYIHYFDEKGSAGFQSSSTDTDLDPQECTFFDSGFTEGFEIINYAVISLPLALKAAKEFNPKYNQNPANPKIL